METELNWCEHLFKHSTIRLLCHKYLYYVLNEQIIKDISYDGEEKSWYVMGIALGHLNEEDHSPCVDWDEKHPLAKEGKDLAMWYVNNNKLLRN